MPSCPARRRWFHSCMVRPMTLRPSARSMAATVEESAPPDMATAMVGVSDMSIPQPDLPCLSRLLNFYSLASFHLQRNEGCRLAPLAFQPGRRLALRYPA